MFSDSAWIFFYVSADDAAKHASYRGKRVRERGAVQLGEKREEAEQPQRAGDREDAGEVWNEASAAVCLVRAELQRGQSCSCRPFQGALSNGNLPLRRTENVCHSLHAFGPGLEQCRYFFSRGEPSLQVLINGVSIRDEARSPARHHSERQCVNATHVAGGIFMRPISVGVQKATVNGRSARSTETLGSPLRAVTPHVTSQKILG